MTSIQYICGSPWTEHWAAENTRETLPGKFTARTTYRWNWLDLHWVQLPRLWVSTLAWCYSVVDFCSPVWQGSAHTNLVDAQLHSPRFRHFLFTSLPVLANIELLALQRVAATDRLLNKVEFHPDWQLHDDCFDIIHPLHCDLSLESHFEGIPWQWMCPVSGVKTRQLATVMNSSLVDNATIRLPSFHVPRRQWLVITESFPNRMGPLWHVSKEMGSDRQSSVRLQWHPDNVTHRQLLSLPNLTVVYKVCTLQTRLPLIGYRRMTPTHTYDYNNIAQLVLALRYEAHAYGLHWGVPKVNMVQVTEARWLAAHIRAGMHLSHLMGLSYCIWQAAWLLS